MSKLSRVDISRAETMRYAKIQNIINLLQGKGNSVEIDAVLGNDFSSPFEIGRAVTVDGDIWRVWRKIVWTP